MRISIFGIFLFIAGFLSAQEHNKGDVFIGFSAGPGFTNFINGEAPHKIFIYGSDILPGIFSSSDLTKTAAYTDYQTGLFKDLHFGLISGFQIEYFVRKNLSIQAGIMYESKGVNLNYSNTKEGYLVSGTRPSGTINEVCKIKIINSYATFPILFRRYLFEKQYLFVEGGIYTGYLISSRITFLNRKTVSDETGTLYDYFFWIDNRKDTRKEYTNKVDFGFSAGTGFVKKLSDKLSFKTEILMNIGIIKTDSKYNNEYSVTPVASGMDLSHVAVRSTNYFGLNSKSRNIDLGITLGLACKIGK